MKILIVDDDEMTRSMYTEVFNEAGFNVVEAKDGVEGLDTATKEIPDVIFTGIIMPRMDGFSLMEALKKNVATANIPVVMSSHMGREEDRQKAEKLGVKDFVVRDMTPPVKVVDRINSIFLKGVEYKVEFNSNALDAQKLARDLSFNSNFQCPECDEKLVLSLRIKNVEKLTFEAQFVCPDCGWKTK
ncbi:regulator of RpoS [bacterium BMS3Abin15]|nr:regulator of RpoS [bacterium BMS3Abin15]